MSRLLGGDTDPDEAKRKVRSSNPGAMVQTFRFSELPNSAYFEMIAAQTLTSEARHNLLAKKPEIDFILRLAGTAQISEAIKKMGASKGSRFVLVAAVPEGKIRGIEGLGEPVPRRRLGKAELDRVEKAAMLNAERA